MAHDPHEHERDRLAEVEDSAGDIQDRGRIPDVGVDVLAHAFFAAGQQGARVGEYQGVVVHVQDPALRSHPLRDFVRVVGRGQAGADVEELPDPGLARQVTDRAGEEAPGRAGDDADAGENLQVLVPGLSVDRELSFPPSQ